MVLIDTDTLAVKISRRGSAPRNAASDSRRVPQMPRHLAQKKIHRLRGETLPQLRDAFENDPGQWAERAGVEIGDGQIEQHGRAGLSMIATVGEAGVQGTCLR